MFVVRAVLKLSLSLYGVPNIISSTLSKSDVEPSHRKPAIQVGSGRLLELEDSWTIGWSPCPDARCYVPEKASDSESACPDSAASAEERSLPAYTQVAFVAMHPRFGRIHSPPDDVIAVYHELTRQPGQVRSSFAVTVQCSVAQSWFDTKLANDVQVIL